MENKYRAWDKARKRMVQNPQMDYCELDSGNFGFTNMYDEFGRQVEDFILMEFIGIKDKNEKEIYEKDIVKYESSYENEEPPDSPQEVYWVDQLASFSPFCHRIKWRCDINKTEVIGNIYENPELKEE